MAYMAAMPWMVTGFSKGCMLTRRTATLLPLGKNLNPMLQLTSIGEYMGGLLLP